MWLKGSLLSKRWQARVAEARVYRVVRCITVTRGYGIKGS